MTIGQKVFEIRKSKNMNLRQFGELVQLRFGYINQLEKDRANAQSTKQISPTLRTLVQICEKTGYDFAIFLAETGYINPERVCMNNAEADLLKAFRGNYDNNFIELNKNKSEKVEKGLEIGK